MKTNVFLNTTLASFATLILTLYLVDLRVVFDPPYLLPLLNTLFLSLIPLITAFTAARLFISVGRVHLLLLSTGMLSLSVGGLVSGWFIGHPDGPNTTITIYNSATLLCAIVLLTGKALMHFMPNWDVVQNRRHALAAACVTGVLLIISGIVFAAMTGASPLYILQGVGPTPFGKLVLLSSILCFLVSAITCSWLYLKTRSSLLRWYAAGMILFALGLTAVLLQKAVGTPIGWAGRAAQYTGGCCLLAGVWSFWHKNIQSRQSILSTFAEFSQKRISDLEDLTQKLHRVNTEHQSSEASLRESKSRYRNLVEMVPAIIYHYSLKRGGVFYSPQVEAVFGYPLQTFYDKPLLWKQSIHPDDAKSVEAAIAKLLARPDSKIEITYRVSNSFGEWIWLHDSFTKQSADDDDVMIYGVAQDVSAIRKLEAEKAQVQTQLLSSERLASLGILAAGVAHEVNNPLSIIDGYLQIIQNKCTDACQQGNPAVVIKVQDASKRIATIIKGLLSFARPAQDSFGPVDVHAAIVEIESLVANMLNKENIALKNDFKAEHPVIRANASKLQQVILNMIANSKDAIKDSQKPGSISIATSDAGESLCISVSDTGAGIDKNSITKIFDPFYTSKDPGKGTGLGLSISSSIISSFGGTINVESEKNVGTTMHITLPKNFDEVTKNTVVAAVAKKPAEIAGTVIVVDDEEGIRSILRFYLEELGLQVEEAGNGEEALEKLKAKNYQFVLTDMQMPKMNGDVLISEARKLSHLAQCKFVIITGGDLADLTKEQRECVSSAVHGVLEKPFNQAMITNMFTHNTAVT